MPVNRKPIFDAVRGLLKRGFEPSEVKLLDAAIDVAEGASSAVPQIGISDADFAEAARRLRCSVAQIRAVWEVEAAGSGWHTDVRASILDLDGPGGFIDGPNLPKILFEAHHFSKFTKGKFNQSHPNISSPVWKRSLYVGGVGEYQRLWTAMDLDRNAALLSASVGAPQIMGFNFRKAGCSDVESFWAFMKVSERNHLLAFCNFIENEGLCEELRMISNDAITCRSFAAGYNGSGYLKNEYDLKIAKAHKKWSAK